MASNPDLPPGMSDAGQNGSKFDIGALMRASRTRLGEDIQNAARTLRIRAVYLEAIEEGRFEDLPGPTYTVGFIRAYAEYLGLDGEEIVRRFKAVGETPPASQKLSFPTPVPDRGLPGGAILMIGIVIAVIGYGGWYIYTSQNSVLADLVPAVPERLTSMLDEDSSANADSHTINATSATQGSSAPPAAVAATPPPPESVVAPAESSDTAAPEQPAPASAAMSEPSVTAEPLPVAETTAGDESEPAATPASEAASAAPRSGPMTEPAESTDPAAPEQAVMVDAAPDDVRDIDKVVARQSAATEQVASLPEPAVVQERVQEPAQEAAAAPEPAHEVQEETAAVESSAESQMVERAGTDRSEQAAAEAPAPMQTASAAPEKNLPNIEVHAKIDSWIQVRDDQANQLVMTRLLKGGDSFSVPSRKGLTLLTGNAGALQIMVDGEVVPSIGPPGAVRRRVSLDASLLKAGNAVIE